MSESHVESCIGWTSYEFQFEHSATENKHLLSYLPPIHYLILKICPLLGLFVSSLVQLMCSAAFNFLIQLSLIHELVNRDFVLMDFMEWDICFLFSPKDLILA